MKETTPNGAATARERVRSPPTGPPARSGWRRSGTGQLAPWRSRCRWVGLLLLAVPALAEPYQPTWESLARHEAAPEWFRDAKFGIYFHWGVYSVPAFGSEWYPRNMYLVGNAVNKHHIASYGDPTVFGYPDFVPSFRAEKFDPAEWADLFVKAGAKFAGPVAEHHDGFAMWASKLTPWNAKQMGPQRDITGELEQAIRARGMRFVTTFHHARNSLWQRDGKWTGHYDGVKANYPKLLDDPQRAILYGYLPREQFLDMWLGKLKEVIDSYHPDMIWFDSWLDTIPAEYQQEFASYYLNHEAARGVEPVITCKQQDLPVDFAVEDFEKGRADQLTELPWLTDDTISMGSWCYTDGLRIKSTAEVLHVLLDIVSKNGHLLLNISPKADGTIPDDQRGVLLGLGAWLDTCGEAVYETRPWLTYGEGPTKMKKGGHFVGNVTYTPEDIRYTRSKSGRTLYATCLGWPTGEVTLRSVKVDRKTGDAAVTMLGHGLVDFRVNDAGQPVIAVPNLPENLRPVQDAVAFRLTGFEVSLHPDATTVFASALKLEPGAAVIDGSRLKLEEQGGRPNLGFWDDPKESAHWLVRVETPGTYQIVGDFASLAKSTVAVDLAGQTIQAELTPTGSWSKSAEIVVGTVTVGKPGVYHLVLRAADPSAWKAVNVFGLRLQPER